MASPEQHRLIHAGELHEGCHAFFEGRILIHCKGSDSMLRTLDVEVSDTFDNDNAKSENKKLIHLTKGFSDTQDILRMSIVTFRFVREGAGS